MLRQMVIMQLKSAVRDRSALGLAFVLPIGIAILFGVIIRSEAKPVDLAVVDTAPSTASQALVSGLDATEQIEIVQVKDERSARKGFDEGDYDAALIVPDISSGGTLTLLYDEKQIEGLQRVAGTVDAFVQRYNLQIAGAQETVKLEIKGARADKGLADYDSMLPTILIFGVLFSSLGALASRIVAQRESGVFKRLSATPLRPETYLLSEIIARLIIALLQTAAVLAIAVYVYNATVAGDAGWIFLMALVATLVFTGIGVLVASFSPSAESTGTITGVATMLMIFLSGPTGELFPAAVTKAGEYLPVGPIVSGLRTVILDGNSPFGLDAATLTLALWTVVPIALASKLFRFSPPVKPKP